MSRFAANHPEDWEERTERMTDHADFKDTPTPLRACVACGKLSRLRWCSNACFYGEDGYDEERDR